MKIFNTVFGMLLIMWSCVSCDKDFSVDLSDRGYVRLNKQAVSLTVGEKYRIKANTDSVDIKSKQLTWSIKDVYRFSKTILNLKSRNMPMKM